MLNLLGSLIGPVTGLLDKFIEDKDTKNALAHEIATLSQKQAQEAMIAQLEVNKAEAAHKSLFVAGWRPFIGWVCGLGFFSNFIVIPVANFVLQLLSNPVIIPMIDTSQMMPVLMGMLGLGAMRTVEKVQKVSREK
jgi:hypothetical protein